MRAIPKGADRACTLLTRVLASHHKQCLGLYSFVKASLEGRGSKHALSAIAYVHRQPEWARQINRLQPRLTPEVRAALRCYLREVAALARVIRSESAVLKTNKKRLNSALMGVFRESRRVRSGCSRLPR